MPASRGDWTEAEYISVVLHELAHVLFFVEAEKKADLYSKRFVRKDAK
jgi:predicted SprT family Zn-dependent metalloprotease